MKPMEIEKRSFEIISEELGDRKIDPEYDLLVRRVIHTTADFDYYDNLVFSPHAVEQMKKAIRSGCDVITDTTMAMSGIALAAKRYCSARVREEIKIDVYVTDVSGRVLGRCVEGKK